MRLTVILVNCEGDQAEVMKYVQSESCARDNHRNGMSVRHSAWHRNEKWLLTRVFSFEAQGT